MQLLPLTRTILFLLSCGLFMRATASTVYNEAVSGDLSNSGLSPTVLAAGNGSNEVMGTTGSGALGVDRDYFTFTVASGLELNSVVELAGTTVGGALSFIGIESGDQVTLSTSASSASGLLGWAHYSSVGVDTDLLPTMSIANDGSSGFTPPLGPGSYAVWIQELSPGAFPYAFDFELGPVATPEPATYSTALIGVIAATLAFRRRIRV